MIRVDRTTVAVPAALAGDDSPGVRELVRARTHYSKKENRAKSFNFAAYKHETIKTALHDLFHGKCAYCESRYDLVQPMDVEHYRPKGGVIVRGKLVKPGYWWLAAAWDNLLPSCIDCNRQRYQRVDGDGDPVTRGKENLFPVQGRRATRPGQENRETRLLLDPCRDDPSRFLTFGERGLIKPRPRLDKLGKRIAKESIETYGLDRVPLAEERHAVAQRVFVQAQGAAKAVRALIATPGSAPKRRNAAIELHALLAFQKPRSAYVALASELVGQAMARFRPLLEQTVGNKLPARATGKDVVERLIRAYPPPPLPSSMCDAIDSILGPEPSSPARSASGRRVGRRRQSSPGS